MCYRLAGMDVMGIKWKMDWADILNAIREAGPEKDASNDCKSVSLNKLQECQVKNGVARQKHCAGSQRRLVNNHSVGVVNLYTQRYFDEEI